MLERNKAFIGSHVDIKGTILQTLKEINPIFPVQIFAGSPKSYARKEPKDCKEILELVTKNNINFFIHSAYVINLGQINQQGYNCLLNDLLTAEKIDAKGCVVHCGKSVKLPKEEALKNMRTNITSILKSFKGTKLLLETCCGQGTELLSNMDDFISFCIEYKDYENFGICLDTCHTMVAGYDPSLFLEKIYEAGLETTLVHFNGSKECKGSCKDRHEFFLSPESKIPVEEMDRVIDICLKYNIPMVVE